MTSRYVIIGAGAVGALLAAQLELAGKPVVLLARGRNLEVVREQGVTVRRPHSTDQVRDVRQHKHLHLRVGLVRRIEGSDADCHAHHDAKP